jgi:hypothetical protein
MLSGWLSYWLLVLTAHAPHMTQGRDRTRGGQAAVADSIPCLPIEMLEGAGGVPRGAGFGSGSAIAR